MNFDKAYYTFFHRKSDKVFKRIIITNIMPIYESIKNKSKLIEEQKGFYLNSHIMINSDSYLLVKITPGNVIRDTIKLTAKHAEKIVIAGIVGGLREKDKIGDMISPAFVTSVDTLKYIEYLSQCNKSEGIICECDGMVHETNFYEMLIANKVSYVDMESFTAYSLCKQLKIKLKLVAMISDKPITEPFYNVTQGCEFDYESFIEYL